MSTTRHSPGGWVADKLDACRWCKGPIPKARRTFCSKACVTEHRIRTDANFVRRKVFERDRGICAGCSRDCFAGSTRPRRARGSGDLWQADHIHPVAEGGGVCGLENFRTLCTSCHKAATAALRKRLARKSTAD